MDSAGYRIPLELAEPLVKQRPFWQLPPGVSRGTWDYVQSATIARDYDRYFADHQLLRLDVQFLENYLPQPQPGQPAPLVADFGCGTGRVARQLGPRGLRMLNIDLSLAMLRIAQDACQESSVAQLRANLVQLDALADNCLDLGCCLFSSLGMLRGRPNRREFLSSAARCLKPSAWLILHVHNRSSAWRDPGGLRWLITSRWNSWTRPEHEFGDRSYAYRGLPAMFLHVFSRSEIVQDLRAAGFTHIEVFAIDGTSTRLLPQPSWMTQWRAGGYFLAARVSSPKP